MFIKICLEKYFLGEESLPPCLLFDQSFGECITSKLTETLRDILELAARVQKITSQTDKIFW